MSSLHLQCAVFALLVALSASAWGEVDQSPRELIMTTTERLVTELRENRDEVKVNRKLAHQLAETIVVPHIDLAHVNRWVLGRHWNEATDAQRKRFAVVFKRFLMGVYVTAMVTYVDDIISHAKNVSYPPLEPAEGSRNTLVRTLIQLPSGARVEVNYRMHRVEGAWKVFDVNVLGISLASIYRTLFATEIARAGLDGLIQQLDDKTKGRGGTSASAEAQ